MITYYGIRFAMDWCVCIYIYIYIAFLLHYNAVTVIRIQYNQSAKKGSRKRGGHIHVDQKRVRGREEAMIYCMS